MLDNHECVQIKFLISLGCALCHSGHFPAVTACFSSPACHLKRYTYKFMYNCSTANAILESSQDLRINDRSGCRKVQPI